MNDNMNIDCDNNYPIEGKKFEEYFEEFKNMNMAKNSKKIIKYTYISAIGLGFIRGLFSGVDVFADWIKKRKK